MSDVLSKYILRANDRGILKGFLGKEKTRVTCLKFVDGNTILVLKSKRSSYRALS